LAIDSPNGLQQASEDSSRVSLQVSAPADGLREELLNIDGVQSVTQADVPGQSGILNVDCHVNAGQGIEAAIARVAAAKWDLYKIERQQPTLENVFLRYIGEQQQEAA